MKLFTRVVTGILVLAAVPAARANLLQNGGFESPGYQDSQGTFIGTGFYREMSPGAADITGWSISGPSPAINWDKITTTQGQSGTYAIFFGPNGNVGGTISQTFNTIPGTVYEVSLRAASGVGNPVVRVSAAGQAGEFVVQPTLPTWQVLHWRFTANSPQTTLAISKPSNGPNGGAGFELDDVAVSTIQVETVSSGERWFELRCSATVTSTNYVVPQGRVLQLMDWKGPTGSGPGSLMIASLQRPEGEIKDVDAYLGQNSYIMGPAEIKVRWLGKVAGDIYVGTFREFDAVTPPLQIHLEAATTLPNFQPASAFFRTRQ